MGKIPICLCGNKGLTTYYYCVNQNGRDAFKGSVSSLNIESCESFEINLSHALYIFLYLLMRNNQLFFVITFTEVTTRQQTRRRSSI